MQAHSGALPKHWALDRSVGSAHGQCVAVNLRQCQAQIRAHSGSHPARAAWTLGGRRSSPSTVWSHCSLDAYRSHERCLKMRKSPGLVIQPSNCRFAKYTGALVVNAEHSRYCRTAMGAIQAQIWSTLRTKRTEMVVGRLLASPGRILRG